MSSLRVKYILVGNVIYVSTLRQKKTFFYVARYTRLIVYIAETVLLLLLLAVIIMVIDYDFFLYGKKIVSGRYCVYNANKIR